MTPHDKLFIPGPVEVSEKTWAAFTRPLIGHRSEDFKNLYRAIHPGLQTLFGTKQPVFLSTSSAWGVMEASIRNLVDRGVLCCMCGAFSDKWFDVAKRCGKNAEPLQVEWGKHIDPKGVDRQLATGKFDTVTLTHSETSTGVMNPLPEICCVLAKYPDVALILDTVSSFSAVKIDMDALGIDVMLTGAQKALALFNSNARTNFDIKLASLDALDAELSRSVESMLVADVPLGAFVSGGVDSTVAYTLCLRALGPEAVHGASGEVLGLLVTGPRASGEHCAMLPGGVVAARDLRAFWLAEFSQDFRV